MKQSKFNTDAASQLTFHWQMRPLARSLEITILSLTMLQNALRLTDRKRQFVVYKHDQ